MHLLGSACFVFQEERCEPLAADGLRVSGHGGIARRWAAGQPSGDRIAQRRVRDVGRRAHLGARPVHQHLHA